MLKYQLSDLKLQSETMNKQLNNQITEKNYVIIKQEKKLAEAKVYLIIIKND